MAVKTELMLFTVAPGFGYISLAWKIPWTEEPGRLQSMGSLRVRHDCVTSLSLFTFMHWRRKWQPTPCSCLENPRDGEPGRLPSMGSHRVRHNWNALTAAAALLFVDFILKVRSSLTWEVGLCSQCPESSPLSQTPSGILSDLTQGTLLSLTSNKRDKEIINQFLMLCHKHLFSIL